MCIRDSIYAGDFRIDAVYRRLVTFEAVQHWDEIQEFIDGYLNDEFVMIGSFKSQVMHDKRIFIKLFEDRVKKFLSKDELEFIEKHIPYTAMLTSETFEEVLKNNPSSIEDYKNGKDLSLIHISEPTRLHKVSRMPSSA